MIHNLFNHHWWTYLIVAYLAYTATFIFDGMKDIPQEADDHGEDKEDKFRG